MRVSRKSPWLVVLLLSAVLLGGCTGSPVTPSSTNPEPAPLRVGATDSGSKLEMQLGQQLILALDSNPSTGYTWQNKDEAPEVLRSVGAPKFSSKSTAIGAGGTQQWTYQATRKGSGTLAFVYVRPWETTASPVQSWTADVLVK